MLNSVSVSLAVHGQPSPCLGYLKGLSHEIDLKNVDKNLQK